ncbi:reverse transcriptase domain-containing protein [Tanacetum coccineum]
MMIKGGKIQKSNLKSLKAKGKGKANGKGKLKSTQLRITPATTARSWELSQIIHELSKAAETEEQPKKKEGETPEKEKTLGNLMIQSTTNSGAWVDGCGAGVILTDPEGVEFTYALRFQFKATNNEAEYEALIAGLRIAEKIGVQNLEVNVDSKLVANQVNGTYIAKETDMIKYLEKVKALASTFRAFSIKQVPRSKNKKADALSKMASTSFAHLSKQVLVEELKEKSVNESEVLAVVEEEGGPSQANYVLREIHEGSCSMHAGTRSVVAKALRIGYYWPTMHKDARALIRACQECQVHKPVLRNPQEKLNPITSPWPFYKWGINIVGPFPQIGPGKVQFLKWPIEFGLPGEIISDNGKQFRDNPFKEWNGSFHPWRSECPLFIIVEVNMDTNVEALQINFELLEKKSENKHYEQRQKSRDKLKKASSAEDIGKLGPKYEGPYEVTEALGKGSYRLKDSNRKELPRAWNVCLSISMKN